MLLIMSGSYVQQELGAEFGSIPPSFLPLANKRLFKHQVSLGHDGQAIYLVLPEDFVFDKLLSPFAPHICEEIWEFIGGEGLLAVSEWPKYDEGKTIAKTVEIGVQVNGKVRGTIVIPNGCEKEKAFEIAKADERIASFLEGKNLIKEIYVPNKIVNFVAK